MTPTRHLELWLDYYLRAVGIAPNGPTDRVAYGRHLEEQMRRAAYSIRWLERHRPRRKRLGMSAGEPGGDGVPMFPAELSFPLNFGPFLVLRELGRGGFGVVLLVRRLPDGPPIALKLPRPEQLVDDVLLRQFVQEARLTARLDHPNLIRVIESGSIGPLHYICSPYYPGSTLSQWSESLRGPVPIGDAVAIIGAVGEGLHFAHERGVLHRDISPNNIILVPIDAVRDRHRLGAAAGTGFVPMLGDFGLSSPIGTPDDAGDPVAAGTINYLAPEGIDPEFGPSGPATDLFALGAVLYELLTGRPPFSATTREETLRRIVEDEPTAPRRLRPEVSEPLELACLRCLSKRPGDRFPSVGSFVVSLGLLGDAGPPPDK